MNFVSDQEDQELEDLLASTGGYFTSQQVKELEKEERQKTNKTKDVDYYVPGTAAVKEAITDKE